MSTSLVAQQVGDRLRELRTASGLSMRTLATRAGFSASFISQIELGQASPSIESLNRLAGALGVSLSDFFGRPVDSDVAVVRTAQRQLLTSQWSRAQVEALSPLGASQTLQAMLVTFEPGGRSGGAPAAHATDKFALVFDGELQLAMGEAVHHLQRGDAVTIRAGMTHSWCNASALPAQVVVVSNRNNLRSLVAGVED